MTLTRRTVRLAIGDDSAERRIEDFVSRLRAVPDRLRARWTATHEALLPAVIDAFSPCMLQFASCTVQVMPTLAKKHERQVILATNERGQPVRPIVGRAFEVFCRRNHGVNMSFDAFRKRAKVLVVKSKTGRLTAKEMCRATHQERVKAWRSLESECRSYVKPHRVGGDVTFADQTCEVADQVGNAMIAVGAV